MIGYVAGKNVANCMDLQKLDASVWNQEQENIECVSCWIYVKMYHLPWGLPNIYTPHGPVYKY